MITRFHVIAQAFMETAEIKWVHFLDTGFSGGICISEAQWRSSARNRSAIGL
jgi:hypothetical protein